MKVPVNDIKEAISIFELDFCSTLQTKLKRFLMGVALAKLDDDVNGYLASYVDANGMVDIDKMKKEIAFGLKACEGDFSVPVDFGPILTAAGVKPEDVSIKQNDIERLFNEVLPAVMNANGNGNGNGNNNNVAVESNALQKHQYSPAVVSSMESNTTGL